MRYHNHLPSSLLRPNQRRYLLKRRRKQSLPSDSSQGSGSCPLSSASTTTTPQDGCIKTSVDDSSSSLKTFLRKKAHDLCSLCRLDTARAHWRQSLSQLGIWVDIQTMNLSVAVTRVRLRWVSLERYVSYSANQPIKLPSARGLIVTVSLPRLGLLLMVAVMSLPVLAVASLVRALMSLLSMIR